MNNRPHSITAVGWIFIASGIIALLTGFLLPLTDSAAAAGRIATHPFEFRLTLVIQMLAVLYDVLMLYGFNWARWLLLIWVGYHIILSILHSPFELLVHGLLFTVVLYFVFRPQASAYFRDAKAKRRRVLSLLQLAA